MRSGVRGLLGVVLVSLACAPAPDATLQAPTPPPRPASSEIRYPKDLEIPDDLLSPLSVSIYSLPSQFFTATDAGRFLRAVRQAAPDRTLLVFADSALSDRLRSDPRLQSVQWLASDGHALTPWPRDPLTLARAADGSVVAVARPNVQPGRQADQELARLLVESLPQALVDQWRPHWTVAPLPFHNGQVLLTRDATWLSLHALETRALQILNLNAVPVESFGSPAGVSRYSEAIAAAASEVGRDLYRRPVRFVHPLPDFGTAAQRKALLYQLGGGAGYDLDSLLTLVPHPSSGQLLALVADLDAGSSVLETASLADLAELASLYGLSGSADGALGLRAALAAAQLEPRARGLDGYLDLMAEHLNRQGVRVSRLPLLVVPTALLRDHVGVTYSEFLLTWNNVVVEPQAGRIRAEGFASGLAGGDQRADAVFAAAGCDLTLLPTLARSVIGNGGYRCASNHLRFQPSLH